MNFLILFSLLLSHHPFKNTAHLTRPAYEAYKYKNMFQEDFNKSGHHELREVKNGAKQYAEALDFYFDRILTPLDTLTSTELLQRIDRLHAVMFGSGEGSEMRTTAVQIQHRSGRDKLDEFTLRAQKRSDKNLQAYVNGITAFITGEIGSEELSKINVKLASLCKEAFTIPPLPSQIRGLLASYSENILASIVLKDISTEQVYLLAAYAHQEFVKIHPFNDGNGRVARLMMNLVFMAHEHPACVFSQSQDYRDAVHFSFTTDENDPIAQFAQYLQSHCAT